MNLQKYKVESGNKEHFVSMFKEKMDVQVKTIICIDTLYHHVDPIGEMPVGFVYVEKEVFYLLGWTDRKKRCHPQNLYPHRKKEAVLYGTTFQRKWTFCELYKCVFQRLHQLDDPPKVISSINNWEDNRQALYTCSKLINKPDVIEKLKVRELRLVKLLVIDNLELLTSICEALGLEVSITVLQKHVESLYKADLTFNNKEGYANSGILNLIEEHVSSKWNI